jgi:hypothetical protein
MKTHFAFRFFSVSLAAMATLLLALPFLRAEQRVAGVAAGAQPITFPTPIGGIPRPTGILYEVTSTGDGDNVGSSNFCDDGTGNCTLRAAIEASNSHVGTDGIEFNIPTSDPGYNGTFWTINLTRALPDVSDGVTITGSGADKLTVRRNTGGDYRIFNVTTTGVVTFSGMTISDGSLVGGLGGGISNQSSGTVNVINSVLRNNHVFGAGPSQIFGDGGAIFNFADGTVSVISSTISGSIALQGTAIDNNGQAGTVNITNSTISNNFGAQAIANYGTVNVTNSTISSNFAPFTAGSSGIRNGLQASANVKSSMIALNTGSSPSVSDVEGAFTSGGFNLIGKADGSSGFSGGINDQTGTIASPLDPKLDPNGLQNNGGPTPTIALLSGSPAIDQGTSNGLTGTLTTDQRGTGFVRTFDDANVSPPSRGDNTDIGAFELQPSSAPAPTPASKLANISTRALVQTGDNVMIGGFIIVGTDPQKLILRAIGPSLSNPPISLTNVLQNPTLSLFNGQGNRLFINDDWRSDQQAEIIATGLQPSNDAESAIVTTLPPGNYTAIVSGANNTTGLALVEVFGLN